MSNVFITPFLRILSFSLFPTRLRDSLSREQNDISSVYPSLAHYSTTLGRTSLMTALNPPECLSLFSPFVILPSSFFVSRTKALSPDWMSRFLTELTKRECNRHNESSRSSSKLEHHEYVIGLVTFGTSQICNLFNLDQRWSDQSQDSFDHLYSRACRACGSSKGAGTSPLEL